MSNIKWKTVKIILINGLNLHYQDFFMSVRFNCIYREEVDRFNTLYCMYLKKETIPKCPTLHIKKCVVAQNSVVLN